MSNDSVQFFSGGITSAKFEKPGATVTGTVCEEPSMMQQTTPEGKLKTWDDGNPMLQLVVTLQTAERDPEIEDDDGQRRVYIKGQMRTAVQQALRQARSKSIDVGGTLTVTYTHDGERTNPAFSPPKQYVAVYEPPKGDQSAFFGNGQQQATAQALPPGMTQEVWDTLSDEAKAALGNLVGK